MKVTFRGVRGSFPVAMPHVSRHGGNTPCVQVDTADATILIDAGTGIRAAGNALVARGVDEIHLLLSHTHWDHIQGLPHFAPLYAPGTRLHIHGLAHGQRPLAEALSAQQHPAFFPVALDALPARISVEELRDAQTITLGSTRVTCRRLNHPGLTCSFRLEGEGAVLAYLCDVDLTTDQVLGDGLPRAGGDRQEILSALSAAALDLARDADLLVCDTFFLPDEYQPDWGHSRPQDALDLARRAGARQVALFHHEPHRGDAALEAVFQEYRQQCGSDLALVTAIEGAEHQL